MNFEASEDHAALVAAVDRMVSRELVRWAATPVRFKFSRPLQQQIEEAGIFGCIAIEELGPTVAAGGEVIALTSEYLQEASRRFVS